MKDRIKFQAGTGITSILMIFVVLCLTTLGVLSYATAKNDSRLAQKNLDNMNNVYNASSDAQICIMNLHKLLNDNWDKNISETDNLNNIKNNIQSIVPDDNNENITVDMVDSGVYLNIIIDNNRQYSIILEIGEENGTGTYNIKKYSIENSEQWNGMGMNEFQ